METEPERAVDAIWVKPHLNRQGNLVRGHWRTRPRVIRVKGHFREFTYVKPHIRRRPIQITPMPMILAGLPPSQEHSMINILRDVEPLMGY